MDNYNTIIKVISIGTTGKAILNKLKKNEYFDYIVQDCKKFDSQQECETLLKESEIVIIIAVNENNSIPAQLESLGKASKKLGVYSIFAITDDFSETIKNYADSIIIIDNDNQTQSIQKLNSFLQVIYDFTYIDGMICIDVADIKLLLKNALDIDIGVGISKGIDAFENSLIQALDSLTNNNFINKSNRILIHIYYHKKLYYSESRKFLLGINKHISKDANMLISLFQNNDDKEDTIKVTIVRPLPNP